MRKNSTFVMTSVRNWICPSAKAEGKSEMKRRAHLAAWSRKESSISRERSILSDPSSNSDLADESSNNAKGDEAPGRGIRQATLLGGRDRTDASPSLNPLPIARENSRG